MPFYGVFATLVFVLSTFNLKKLSYFARLAMLLYTSIIIIMIIVASITAYYVLKDLKEPDLVVTDSFQLQQPVFPNFF